MKKSWALALAALAVIVIIAGVAWWETRPVPVSAAALPGTQSAGVATPAAADDHVLGDPNAPITIVEYASLTCPHCAAFDREVLPKLKQAWIDTGKAKLIYRDFPLDKSALMASMVAACAPPDRYFSFLDVLFSQQGQWAQGGTDPAPALTRIAKLGGMSEAQVQSCLANETVQSKILAGQLAAQKELGVNSTPTFFINGRKLVGAPTYDKFEEQLQAAAPKS
jgi:protein-disulfide isomerase